MIKRRSLWVCTLFCIGLCQVSVAGALPGKMDAVKERVKKIIGLKAHSHADNKMSIEDNETGKGVSTALQESITTEREQARETALRNETKAEEASASSGQKIQNRLGEALGQGSQMGGPYLILKDYLGPIDTAKFRVTCKTMHNRVLQRTTQDMAREEIWKMVGELKKVEAGSFLMGSEEGEPSYWGNNQKPHHVKIEEGYWLPVDDITVANYHYVMTGRSIGEEEKAAKEKERRGGKEEAKGDEELRYSELKYLIKNKKKPMRSLTEAQWDEFTKRLNEKMVQAWPIAYPDRYKEHGNKVPVFDRPTDEELEYATTMPLAEEIEIDNPEHTRDPRAPEKVRITAQHSLFSGTDRNVNFDQNGYLDPKGEDYKEISKYVVCQRGWADGPSDVDSVLPNARGFRNLSGNIWKQTRTLFNPGDATDNRRVLVGGGHWYASAEYARSASRCSWGSDDADGIVVGFRPVGRVIPAHRAPDSAQR